MARPGENPQDPREEAALSSASGVYNKQSPSLISRINQHRGKIGFLAGVFSGALFGAGIATVNSLDETTQINPRIQEQVDGVLFCNPNGNCVMRSLEDLSPDELEELNKGCELPERLPLGISGDIPFSLSN